MAELEQSAFVTGGSGFIGGRLVARLVGDGWSVRALARSDAAAARVESLGAVSVRGDLDDVASLRAGAQGCAVAFHAAAKLGDWGRPEEFERGNVAGTRNALDACVSAGVSRFVHVGTEAALLNGAPLIHVDERAPLAFDSKSLYSRTKARAEEAVLSASVSGFETVVVRPRFVWGAGDTTVLPSLVRAVQSGRFAWIGGGQHRTSTTHVDNAVEGLVLAAHRGVAGNAYFVTDGEPIQFRRFVEDLLATRGVQAPSRSVPRPVAALLAGASETAWRVLRLQGQPPLTRLAFWVSGLETTIDITKAREQLGYEPVRTMAEGLEELRSAPASDGAGPAASPAQAGGG